MLLSKNNEYYNKNVNYLYLGCNINIYLNINIQSSKIQLGHICLHSVLLTDKDQLTKKMRKQATSVHLVMP